MIYDSGANLLAVNIDGKYYTYVRNIQNDIIALIDVSGKIVVNYAYGRVTIYSHLYYKNNSIVKRIYKVV